MAQVELSFLDAQSSAPAPRVWSVTELVGGADRLLGGEFARVWVAGEVLSVKRTAAGHVFFTLKDDDAVLPVALWRTAAQKLAFELRDGHDVAVCGRLGVFTKQGRFQLYADVVEPRGRGALAVALEQLKRKLEQEGLFSPERKRKLPLWPTTIGVVTSAYGAAIHDIVKVAQQRCASHILLAPATVQGPDAPLSIVAALKRLNAWGVDVVIVGRGGGAFEDLLAFHDESVVRAIAACTVPVVSAVGHESDVSLADLVADVRAATPSHAAELVVPDARAIQRQLHEASGRAQRAIARAMIDANLRVEHARGRLEKSAQSKVTREQLALQRLAKRLQLLDPQRRVALHARIHADLRARLQAQGRALVALRVRRFANLRGALGAHGPQLLRGVQQSLEAAPGRLQRAVTVALVRDQQHLAALAAQLDALSPLSVLRRGYAIVYTEAGAVVRDAAGLRAGDQVRIRVHHGVVRASVLPRDDTP